jgi:hypothetical protein
MRYVYIIGSEVVDVVKVDPYSVFSEEYAAKFIEAPDEVTTLYTFDGVNFIPPPVQEPIDTTSPVQPTKEELLAQINALMQQVQQLTEL